MTATIIKGTNWSGNYSRFTYAEASRYFGVLKEQGKEILDDEFNVIQDALLTFIRRLQLDSSGDGCLGNGFKIVGTGAANDFTITGGASTYGGALAAWVGGIRMPLPASITYLTQEVAPPSLTTPVGARTDTVYLDLWLDEASPSDDATMVDPVIGHETSRRLKLKYKVLVAENASAAPAAYVDANGQQHYTMALAKLSRTATSLINAAMVADLRKPVPRSQKSVTTVTADTTLTAANQGLIKCNGNMTITLPPANTLPEMEFDFEDIDLAIHTTTIRVANPSSDHIDGVDYSNPTQLTLVRWGEGVRLISDGVSKWYITSNLKPTADSWKLFSGLSKLILGSRFDAYIGANADYQSGVWNHMWDGVASAALHLNNTGLLEILTASSAMLDPLTWTSNPVWSALSVDIDSDTKVSGSRTTTITWLKLPGGQGFFWGEVQDTGGGPGGDWSVGDAITIDKPTAWPFTGNPYPTIVCNGKANGVQAAWGVGNYSGSASAKVVSVVGAGTGIASVRFFGAIPLVDI